MLTARDGEHDELTALRLGTDDYVTKPFSTPVLIARLSNLVQRRPAEPLLRLGRLRLHPHQHRALVGDAEVSLTAREFAVLSYLVGCTDRPVSKQELLEEVWHEPYGDPNLVEVCIAGLRRKVGDETIETIRGVGYRFEPRCETSWQTAATYDACASCRSPVSSSSYGRSCGLPGIDAGRRGCRDPRSGCGHPIPRRGPRHEGVRRWRPGVRAPTGRNRSCAATAPGSSRPGRRPGTRSRGQAAGGHARAQQACPDLHSGSSLSEVHWHTRSPATGVDGDIPRPGRLSASPRRHAGDDLRGQKR